MVDPVIALGLVLLLGWVLLDAGLGKLRAPALTAAHIDDYRLLPEGTGAWLARPRSARWHPSRNSWGDQADELAR